MSETEASRVIEQYNRTCQGAGVKDREWLEAEMAKPDGITPWGFVEGGVGPGWRGILLELVRDLMELGWDGVATQVKEKFGGLRFYIGYGNQDIWDRIDDATAASYRTCEVCGAEGQCNKGGWLSTRCWEHTEEQDREGWIGEKK